MVRACHRQLVVNQKGGCGEFDASDQLLGATGLEGKGFKYFGEKGMGK